MEMCGKMGFAFFGYIIGSVILYIALPLKVSLLMIAGIAWVETLRYILRKVHKYC